MTDDDVRRSVLSVVQVQPPLSTRGVRSAVRARAQRTDEALRALAAAGLVRHSAKGWWPVGHARTPPGHASPGLTVDALDAMTPPERITAIWDAMSEAARERAWSQLSRDRVVNAIAILLTAAQPPARRPPWSLATADDQWQREADC